MPDNHRFIVVDEYDNVTGYFDSQSDAENIAEGECAEGCRTTYVYRCTLVKEFPFTEEGK